MPFFDFFKNKPKVMDDNALIKLLKKKKIQYKIDDEGLLNIGSNITLSGYDKIELKKLGRLNDVSFNKNKGDILINAKSVQNLLVQNQNGDVSANIDKIDFFTNHTTNGTTTIDAKKIGRTRFGYAKGALNITAKEANFITMFVIDKDFKADFKIENPKEIHIGENLINKTCGDIIFPDIDTIKAGISYYHIPTDKFYSNKEKMFRIKKEVAAFIGNKHYACTVRSNTNFGEERDRLIENLKEKYRKQGRIVTKQMNASLDFIKTCQNKPE